MTTATGHRLQAAAARARLRAVAVPAACRLKPEARRSGFVLLMVLVVLVLAGTVLAATARRSGREALVASAEMEELRVTWAMRSARAVAEAAAETWLVDEAATGRQDSDAPPVRAARTVRLGTIDLTMVVTDEEAKANINLLAGQGGTEGLVGGLRRLTSRCRTAPQIELVSATPRAEVISAWPRLYQSYAQLYPDARPADLLGGAAAPADDVARQVNAPGVADVVTCWGSGKVNFRRASRDVLRTTLAGLADEGQIDQLIAYRQDVPGGTAAEAVSKLELKDQDRAEALLKALTDTSRCHGLWLVARGSTRSWTRLYVKQEGDAENDSAQWAFQW